MNESGLPSALEPSASHYEQVVRKLIGIPHESELVEFKTGNGDPAMIGQLISALSNSAALLGQLHGYVIWGVEDSTHRIVGTSFVPGLAKSGGELLENWLLRNLNPRGSFSFHQLTLDGVAVVLLEIDRSFRHPTKFKGEASIRVGSSLKKLKDAPEKERDLWRALEETAFEDMFALERATDEEVLSLLDVSGYFQLIGRTPVPNPSTELRRLAEDRLISEDDAGTWSIRNLGVILFARKLSSFPAVSRKAIRVIRYPGVDRTVDGAREQEGSRGYALGFEGLISYIMRFVPSKEDYSEPIRKNIPLIPMVAVREIVANALVHQDLGATGAGPMVEIFTDRLEITNPGEPLIDVLRIIDTPPKSRNEALASRMRRVGVCEERGTGWDKVVSACEAGQLPAPLIEVNDSSTRVTLFTPRSLADLSKEDQLRAVYQHACLLHACRQTRLTNASLRARFGVDPKNSAIISRLIQDAVSEGLIAVFDESVGSKSKSYVPGWAAP